MPGPVQSIERAAAVLQLLAARRSLGLMEIAAALDLAKGTTHGILATLRGVGFIDQDRSTGRYRLAAGILRLGSGGVDPNELRSRAMNLADTLASNSGHTVRMGVLADPGSVEIVHHVFRPDNSRQVLTTGTLVPAHATALGKVLLAHDPPLGQGPEARADAGPAPGSRPPGLEAYTRRTITDVPALRRALVEVRRRGWADEVDEHRPERAGIAAPVNVPCGLVVGAIGIDGPTHQVCDGAGRPLPALVHLVREAAQLISRELEDLR